VSPLLITISNTEQYGNGAIISPNANPQDGIFEICIINPISIVNAIPATKKLFNRKINEVREYVQYKSKNVKIISEKEQGVLHTDGEPHDRQKITEIKILNKALKVCANLKRIGTDD
jgi:diacylglycerol kinase family enzyme